MMFGLRRISIYLALAATCLACAPAQAGKLEALHRFADTGNNAPSHYALGAEPYSELLQASDGNFYGTTVYGGAGLCPNRAEGGYLGCGTVFRMTPKGVVTRLYSFPYDTTTEKAPNGAFPTAGLIQAADGNLYGVAQDGGLGRCNGALGCGTLFRITTAGAFTLLHQFCGGDGCTGVTEGGRAMTHLVQTASGALCGTTSEGGVFNDGTVFCASTGGTVTTLHLFQSDSDTDGNDPVAALLVGPDGSTLYGTTVFGGTNGGAGAGGGIVFALQGTTLTVLHNFDNIHDGSANTYSEPTGALIFGANGQLYGTTTSGGTSGGCIFSLKTDGTRFAAYNVFPITSNSPTDPAAGLVLARNGLMYGPTLSGSIERGFGQDGGIVYSFNPVNGAFKAVADFTGATGSPPQAALIEGADKYLYTTASLYGGSNTRGSDSGSVVRVTPALKK